MSGTEGLNPFPGLRSFEPDEAHLFFGREEQVDELLRRLRRTRFLAVVGSSGSGKSSLVRAGLIPALYGGYMVKAGSSWRIAVLRPGDGPIANLAAALADPAVLGTDGQPQEVQRALVEATLRRGERGLVDAYREARLPAYENLLVVVDQFEELFRFKRSSRRASAEEAAAFVKLLLEAARPEEVPTYVVLTMRSDFVGNCAEFYGLPEAINDGQYLIPRMTREQRRSAISGPVAVGGAEISPRLLTRLLNDVGSSPDQLPILQHALMRTWDWWERRHVDGEPVDLQHYEAIGTMAQALSLHAEEAFEELGSDRLCSVAEKVFKCLTQKDEEGKGIRVPTPVDEICAVTGCSRDEVVEVVEGFRRPGRSFLMPPAGVPLEGDTVVDISHESLMRVWARLRRWVDEEAEAAQSYLRLAAAAAAFQQGLTGLWRDPELQLAVQWREQSQPNEAWARRYDPSFARAMVFLDQSVQERSREVLRRERQQRRQLVRARLMLIAVTAAAFLMLLFGINAWVAKQDAVLREREAKLAAEEADRQRGNAERERLKAEQSFRAAEEARSAAERNQERAEAERAKANRQQDRATAEAAAAERARRQEEEARRQEQRSREEAEHARARAEEERQRAEASRQRAETSEQKALRLRTLEIAHGLALRAQRVQQGGNNQLAALAALEAYTLSRRNGGPAHDPEIYAALRLALGGLGAGVEQVVEGSRDAVRALAFGPDGQTVAAAGDDGAVWLLAERDGRSVRTPLRETGDSVRSLAMSSDGRWLAAAELGGAVLLWDLSRPGMPPEVAPCGLLGASALAFSPVEGLLAATEVDGSVRGCRVTGPFSVVPLAASAGQARATALAWAPDGSRLAVGNADGTVRLIATADAGAPVALSPGGDVRAAAWSPVGQRLAVGTFDGGIALYALDRPAAAPLRLPGHRSSVNALAFTPDGTLLVSGSSDGTVRLWPLAEPSTEPIVLTGHGSWVWAVAVSPDGSRIASGSADRTVRFWTPSSERLAERVCASVSRNMTAEEWRELVSADLPYEPTCPGKASPEVKP